MIFFINFEIRHSCEFDCRRAYSCDTERPIIFVYWYIDVACQCPCSRGTSIYGLPMIGTHHLLLHTELIMVSGRLLSNHTAQIVVPYQRRKNVVHDQYSTYNSIQWILTHHDVHGVPQIEFKIGAHRAEINGRLTAPCFFLGVPCPFVALHTQPTLTSLRRIGGRLP